MAWKLDFLTFWPNFASVPVVSFIICTQYMGFLSCAISQHPNSRDIWYSNVSPVCICRSKCWCVFTFTRKASLFTVFRIAPFGGQFVCQQRNFIDDHYFCVTKSQGEKKRYSNKKLITCSKSEKELLLPWVNRTQLQYIELLAKLTTNLIKHDFDSV